MPIPETHYALNGDLHVAYMAFGEGSDVLIMPNWFSNVEAYWDLPEFVRWLEYFASFSRVITFDQPGTGISDPISRDAPPSLEQWVDSARVVMDAVGSNEAAVMAVDGAFPIAALFAATYPSRTSALVAFDGYARVRAADDYPFGIDAENIDALREALATLWGTGMTQESFNWDVDWTDALRKRWARFERQVASPRTARERLQ